MAKLVRSGVLRYYLAYAGVIIVVLLPLSWVLFSSVKSPDEIFAFPQTFLPRNATLHHYVRIITRTDLGLWVTNTLIVGGLSTLFSLALAAPAAYGFSRYEFRAKHAIMIALLSLQLIPATINIVPLYVMMSSMKLLNTLTSLVLIYTSIRIPFSVWILKSFFDSLPSSLEDAAQIDGCSPLRTFLSIMLPLSLPGLGAAGFLTFLFCWGQFLIPMVIAPSARTTVVGLGLYTFFGQDMAVDFGMVFASSVLATLPILVIFFISQSSFVAGLTKGSVKA